MAQVWFEGKAESVVVPRTARATAEWEKPQKRNMEFARPPLLHRALVGLVLVLLVTRLAATKTTVATVERRDGSATAALDKSKTFSLATDGNEPMVRGDNNGGDTHLAAATFPLQLTGATTVFYFGSNPTPSPIALHVASASKGIVLLARIYPLPTAATGSGSPGIFDRLIASGR